MQIAHLTARRADQIAILVPQMQAAIASGIVPNTLFTSAKETINAACREGTEAFLKTGPHEQKHHQSDWLLQAYHSDAFVSGATNVPTATKRAQKAGMTEYVAYLNTLQPLCDLLNAAKPLIKKRGELPVVKTAKQLADEADRMTCQCCARGIFAATGTIAHHGYERPGYGWQTASCMGAKELPFEADRTVLGHVITALVSRRSDMKATRGQLAAEQLPITRRWTTGSRPNRESHEFSFTRGNFDIEGRDARRACGIYGDFGDLLAGELASRDRQIASIEQDIAAQRARYAGWKQTHRREGGQWVEV